MQLYNIFIQAIDLPEKNRKSFIHKACGGNQNLINEVNALLTSDSENSMTWSNYLSEQAANIDQVSQHYIGEQVGVFKLTRELGAGGMGTVYLGERTDGSFEQQVAVKVINPILEKVIGKDNLIREAGFMAKLNHPSIGKVFDSGQTSFGSPYIVMELVEGKPISTLWEDPTTTLGRKLGIFIELCDAIHHAHQRQVIHADIKPSNILVDNDGQLKVLDFGIARMFELDNRETHSAYTTYVRALTAKYASPEVKCGELPSVYSDVYSLGIVLADLVAFYKDKSSLLELSAIVTKATHISDKDRYTSIVELKQDISRYLRHEVVEAFPATKWFKLKKFVMKKHPMASAFAVATLLTISYLTANLAIQNHHLTLAKQESDLTVEKLSQLLEMADLKKSNGKELYAKDLLDNAKRLITEETELNPDSIAKIKYSLANSFESLGELTESKTLLLEVINSVDVLVNKDLAYNAGEMYIQQLLYANEFNRIQEDTKILIENMAFTATHNDLPNTLAQARFYHQYLNGVKYHLYQSRPSDIGEKHVTLLRNMKEYYWDDFNADTRGSMSGAFAGALLNQLHNGIEFSFEQIEQDDFDSQSKPLIEEAIAATQESIHWYTQLNNQIAIIQKQMILGRAFIEIDQFSEGRKHMESALSSLQKIIGDKHPNNIQFYRIMAGFYAYDEPGLSLEYATKGALLAKDNKQVQAVQYINALDAQLFALNNVGDFSQFKQVSNELLAFYLSIPAQSRTVDILHVVSKTIDQYTYRLRESPVLMTDIALQLKADYQELMIENKNAPERATRLVDTPFLNLVDMLSQGLSVDEARKNYLEQALKRKNETPRQVFVSKKHQLEFALLNAKKSSKTTDELHTLALPHFPWSDKERKQSSHRVDVLLKTAFIYQARGEKEQVLALIAQLETLLDRKSLPQNNGWRKALTQLASSV